MENYIELAHSTSSPLPPCRERLLSKTALLALLYYKMLEFGKLAHDLDGIKRAIFYGNPEAGGNMTLPTDARDCAIHALRENTDETFELLHAGLGLATESGEFLDAIFNHVFEGAALDVTNLHEEIGDIEWYLAKACKFTGTTLELEQVRNIAKLAKRFPNKFTDADALQRNLEEERRVLELEVDFSAES